MAKEAPTATDVLIRRLKNHKAVAVILVLFAVLLAVGQAFDVLQKIWNVVSSSGQQPATPAATPAPQPHAVADVPDFPGSCLFFIFEYVEAGPTDIQEAEVDESRIRASAGRALGNYVAVNDGVVPKETFKVAFSNYRKGEQTDELEQRAEFNFVVDPAARFHSVTRRLMTPTVYTLEVRPVSGESFLRFLGNADFDAKPQCSSLPGVRWWDDNSRPLPQDRRP
jgi:hypothetical protein